MFSTLKYSSGHKGTPWGWPALGPYTGYSLQAGLWDVRCQRDQGRGRNKNALELPQIFLAYLITLRCVLCSPPTSISSHALNRIDYILFIPLYWFLWMPRICPHVSFFPLSIRFTPSPCDRQTPLPSPLLIFPRILLLPGRGRTCLFPPSPVGGGKKSQVHHGAP